MTSSCDDVQIKLIFSAVGLADGTGEDDVAVTGSEAFLNNIPVSKCCIGMGKPKGDQKTGKTKLYSDIVMRARDSTWVTNQWTCKDIVIEGVPRKILDRTARIIHSAVGTSKERRIGHDFARIGLPKIRPPQDSPKLLDGVSITAGYYWINASWDVTGNPGKYKYTIAPGKTSETQKLSEVMRMFNDKSSLTQATIATSTAFNGKMWGSTIVRDGDGCDMSLKIHNAFRLKKECEFLAADTTTSKGVLSTFAADEEDRNEDDGADEAEDDDDLI
ncbi:hypothetical protein B0T18DRAFT_424083 [Schizothecium vesticola]|uniref:Uncharacterized protein n=1 Tax=Schizothecium vesticola TaxID=314040 RepID=A0AA40F9F7_9PEZI|nr:hypothetical protein B0T18DRAFT_424083 [Schizothecium vesticola]